MNLYDKKQVKCSICGNFIGEISNKSSVVFPLCGKCNKKEKNTVRKGIDTILVPIDDGKKFQTSIRCYIQKILQQTSHQV